MGVTPLRSCDCQRSRFPTPSPAKPRLGVKQLVRRVGRARLITTNAVAAAALVAGRIGAPSVFWLMSCVLAASAARGYDVEPARLADEAAGA